jgi:hypothetical protein
VYHILDVAAVIDINGVATAEKIVVVVLAAVPAVQRRAIMESVIADAARTAVIAAAPALPLIGLINT